MSTAPSFPASSTSRRSRWIVVAAVGRWPYEAAIPRTMRTPQARKNAASLRAVGLIAVMPNARSTAVRTCASARRARASPPELAGVRGRGMDLHLPLERLDRGLGLALARHHRQHLRNGLAGIGRQHAVL